MAAAILFQIWTCSSLSAQYLIEGQIKKPSKRYKVFLSILKNWDHFNTIGQDMIIKEAIVDSSGYFRITGDELSRKSGFYRIHLSAAGEPGVMMTGETVSKNYVNFIHSNQDSIRFEFEHMHYAPGELTVNSTHEASEDFFQVSDRQDLLVFSVDSIEYPNYSSLIKEKQLSIMRAVLDSSHSPLTNLFAIYSVRDQLHGDDDRFQDVLTVLSEPGIFPSYKSSLEQYIGAQRYQDLQAENRLLKILSIIVALMLLATVARLYFGKPNARQQVKPVQTELLTSKENQVMKLILAHKTNKEIANELFISDSTVKTHINNIYRKLNLNTRKDLFHHFSDK